MDSIQVTNKKILQFYENNPNVNFEAVNLIFVDLFDKLFDDMNSSLSSTVNSQILTNVENIMSGVNTLSSSVSKLNTDISSSIFIKFQESKREYIEDIKTALSYNFSLSNDKINSVMQQNTSQLTEKLIDKTTLMLNEMIPKSNDIYYTKVMDSISTFHESISQDTKKLLSSSNDDDAMTTFLSAFEAKSNTMLQPIFSFINASEERINKSLVAIKEDTYKEKIMDELSEFLGKYKNSSYKGQFGENQLETVLNKLFPTAEVLNTTGTKASCDFRINRTTLPTILVETKNYDRNVTMDEVKKFIRDIDVQKCHGIFLSQHSGITSKQNFQIDIKGHNILVYVHNVDYCPHTIKIAIDMIDALTDKLTVLEDGGDEIHVQKEMIDDINKEYSHFIERKSSILDILKEFNKKLTVEVEEIKFPTLSKLLVSKCGSILNNENETIICNLCNQFEAANNKSLSAHQRACRKKYSITVPEEGTNIIINTDNIPTDS